MVKISSRLNESLLEMIYFFPLKAQFETILGKKVNAMYKPSQRKEGSLGFDQAWTSHKFSEEEFYRMIYKKSVKSKFLAYLLQFKVVHKQKYKRNINRMFKIPSHFRIGEDYYRVPLKTEKSKTQPTSQHELLLDIKDQLSFIEVYYACPMLYSPKDIYNIELSRKEKSDSEDEKKCESKDKKCKPKKSLKCKMIEEEEQYRDYLLEKLVLVDVASAPSPTTTSWNYYKKHHIMWNDMFGRDIYWCSEPKKGFKQTYKDLIFRSSQKLITAEYLVSNLRDLNQTVFNNIDEQKAFIDVFSRLNILEIED